MTVPAATAVTSPVLETVATAGFDDTHVAMAVTSCSGPLDTIALATNWLV